MYTFALFTLLVLSSVGAMVIQSHWEHVRLKTLPPSKVEGRTGSQVVLVCSATGSPAPQIAWYKDSLFVSHLNSWQLEEEVNSLGEAVARLTLPCLSSRDAGVYECRARSGEHQVSVTTEVLVSSPAKEEEFRGSCSPNQLAISLWRQTLMVEEGATAILPCRTQSSVNGHQVTWRNAEGSPAHQNDVRYTVRENGDLVIRDIRFQDMGQYTCTVNGIGGSDTVHTFLYPLASERNVINK